MYRNMKKLMILLAALTACAAAAAQTTQEEFQTRYERLVRNLGYDGVGIETLLDRWEEAFPDDQTVPVARFNYWFHKGQVSEVVPKGSQRKFLGNAPTVSLKDADGNDVNYFEETFYDEEYFGEAMKVVDAQIAAQPDELRWQYLKLTAMLAYEKESPDMTVAALKALIDRNAKSHPAWTLNGEPANEDVFQQGVAEYCADFFRIGSDISYEYFHDISVRMNKLYPKNPVFLDNIGSWWRAARGDDKQAAKYYQKALKLDPDDYAATQNLRLIERKQAAAKKK